MPSPILAALLGLISGIFVNYLSDILPIRRKLAAPICTYCGTRQHAWNYFVWPRRCHHCGKRRTARTWIVEAAFVALFVWLAQSESSIVPFALAVPVWIFFGTVIIIDLEWKLILHPVSIAGAVLGLVVGTYLYGFFPSVLGGLAGYGILLVLFWIGVLFTRLTRRMQGDDEEVALGFGDVNLAGVLGLMTGWPNIVIGLLFSVLVAGVFSLLFVVISVILRRYRAFVAIPYGPFLVIGASLILFFPDSAQRLGEIVGPLFSLSP